MSFQSTLEGFQGTTADVHKIPGNRAWKLFSGMFRYALRKKSKILTFEQRCQLELEFKGAEQFTSTFNASE